MIISLIAVGLLLGLSYDHIVHALPADVSSVVVTHIASDYFPNTKGDLSSFNVDARYVGYSPETQSWLTNIDPSTGKTDGEKGILLIEAAYAHVFDPLNPDMAADLAALLSASMTQKPLAPLSAALRSKFLSHTQ
ncbi:hypothetical protein V492_03389 [Pseudogymnoascus sp. VKM F-4246]|nr:hypothetical protein V492_03389 [Pseudogymnoascus sp. VKM F-4246]